MVTVRVTVRVRVRVMVRVRVRVRVMVMVTVRVMATVRVRVRVMVMVWVRATVRVRVMVMVRDMVTLMPLHPPHPIPERILCLGPPGSGKTTNILNIAKFALLSNSPAKFWIGDSDFAIARMLPSYPGINAEVFPLYDWDDYKAFKSTVLANAAPDDWVCVDFIGSAWNAVQAAYVEGIFGKEQGDYFFQARKELEAGTKEKGSWAENQWMVINPMYSDWIRPLLYKGRYHVYGTAKSEFMGDKGMEDQNLRNLFLPYNTKPVGQKFLAFEFHTVLIANRRLTGERVLTTVKDRVRTELKGQTVNNFTIDYLVNVAGWSLT